MVVDYKNVSLKYPSKTIKRNVFDDIIIGTTRVENTKKKFSSLIMYNIMNVLL